MPSSLPAAGRLIQGQSVPGSAEFREIWAANPVRAAGHRTMSHPELGLLRINCDVLTIPEDDQQVVFMTADPGTAAARALHHLAARVA